MEEFKLALKALMIDFALYLSIEEYKSQFYLPLSKFKNNL